MHKIEPCKSNKLIIYWSISSTYGNLISCSALTRVLCPFARFLANCLQLSCEIGVILERTEVFAYQTVNVIYLKEIWKNSRQKSVRQAWTANRYTIYSFWLWHLVYDLLWDFMQILFSCRVGSASSCNGMPAHQTQCDPFQREREKTIWPRKCGQIWISMMQMTKMKSNQQKWHHLGK